MLFGGKLTLQQTHGGKAAWLKEKEPRQHTLAEKSEVLHRLTNHELRLLEELERTRETLRHEWQRKLTQLEERHQLMHPKDEELLRSFSPKELRLESSSTRRRVTKRPSSGHSFGSKCHGNEAQMTKSTSCGNQSAMVTSKKASIDMLPVLSSTGEPPFDVGLNAGPSKATKHLLPIFKLPSVSVEKEMEEIIIKEEKVAEDEDDRHAAVQHLGLSLEEIEALETGFHIDRVLRATSLSKPSKGTKKDIQLPFLHKRRRQHQTQKMRRSSHDRSRSAGNTKLKQELEGAMKSVQSLTRMVKEDIRRAQAICPAKELQATAFFRNWGRKKMESTLQRLLHQKQAAAWQKWKLVIAFEKHEEKRHVYYQYKGTKKLDKFLLNWRRRRLQHAWSHWWNDIALEKAMERSSLERNAAETLQRAWRGHRGRCFYKAMQAHEVWKRRTEAATKLQRHFRGSFVRKLLRLQRRQRQMEKAAIVIQSVERGRVGRKVAAKVRQERREYIAASRIQAPCRGRVARIRVAAMKRERELKEAATLIQRRYRGRLGRAAYIRQQIERYHAQMAVRVQCAVRRMLAYRLLRRLQKEATELLRVQKQAATNIQRVYRGHRSRLGTEIKLIALREKNRREAKAATTIQTYVRSKQAIQLVRWMRQERANELVSWARVWVEYWSEDASAWFYYNAMTGEALWQPPVTGYTKSDGYLVLQNGRVIANPTDDVVSSTIASRKDVGDKANKEEGAASDDDDEDDKLCVECEEEDARRHCDQCEDVFCDACYQRLHDGTKREKHTWKAIGALRCIECEKMKATRWCQVCQDPYCLGCYSIIHSKGNKAAHEWITMSELKRQQKRMEEEENAYTYDEYLQSTEYQYVNEYADGYEPPVETQDVYGSGYQEPVQNAEEGDYAGEVADPFHQQEYDSQYNEGYQYDDNVRNEGEWVEAYDETSGYSYWYNTLTGESQWG